MVGAVQAELKFKAGRRAADIFPGAANLRSTFLGAQQHVFNYFLVLLPLLHSANRYDVMAKVLTNPERTSERVQVRGADSRWPGHD